MDVRNGSFSIRLTLSAVRPASDTSGERVVTHLFPREAGLQARAPGLQERLRVEATEDRDWGGHGTFSFRYLDGVRPGGSAPPVTGVD
jgi:hypothetical protein